ncbi:probable glutathione S-transferase parA [Beta vulgaris subsp. vulgaris]|uniref:probable glutathione S-transferase parA n=1 Tax=Beta vulgaris subsp. vulgaris TaxID=3555 RepID=UPI002037183E|nr:probable glutathione S-transferase parA [Beta vulgaris subsp. vulgaris]
MDYENQVVLLDFWSSSYAMRVKIALAEKGVKYVCEEQSLVNKGSLLLEMNPVHKMIPVLIHNGKPICESLVIIQYIDQVWAETSSLLPSDPYHRSQARFWGEFIDKQIYVAAKQLWKAKGEDQERLIKEFISNLKLLEQVINNNMFFGGDTFGYIDVALIPITSWFYTLEKFGNFNIEANCPIIVAWAKRCKERESVSSSLPDPEKVYSFALDIKKALGLD